MYETKRALIGSTDPNAARSVSCNTLKKTHDYMHFLKCTCAFASVWLHHEYVLPFQMIMFGKIMRCFMKNINAGTLDVICTSM